MCRECRLPKGQSLGGAPCVEAVARVMTAMALRLRMSRAESFFLDGNGPFEQRLSVFPVTTLTKPAGEMAEALDTEIKSLPPSNRFSSKDSRFGPASNFLILRCLKQSRRVLRA